jgi:hypothetical protein
VVYWIEWRDHGQRKRKRIGPSKESAELSLGEIRRALVEERYIERDKGARMSLGGLSAGTWDFWRLRQKLQIAGRESNACNKQNTTSGPTGFL